jgi:16S rRNA (cytosine967-C5)-methyltransferase
MLGRIAGDLRAEVRVQDEGSQLVARAVGARPGDCVLDACAAPGGKTMMLAEAMHDPASRPDSRLVAADYRHGRIALLARMLRSSGLAVPIVALDVTTPLPFRDVFDRVLLDAPCSGLGTLRRDPDVKWTRRPDDLPALAAAEQTMLAHASAVVRPGGRLIYATCSSEPDENMDVVRAFLAAQPKFTLEPLTHVPPALITAEGCLTTTPVDHGLDAFFAAVLVRHDTA